ncbi:YbaB/EbfC family nucleoid-associated protein [Microbacterium sp. 16-032]|uniref:YbaB/EbfC family nucleoid-associated protein n=1 Tax=Microbacterium sp. 16-032 TaxID=3239808 RepID=UPI0034E1EF1D
MFLRRGRGHISLHYRTNRRERPRRRGHLHLSTETSRTKRGLDTVEALAKGATMTLSDDSLTALEQARARVQAQTAKARALSHDAARMGDDVRTVTATRSSLGREVRVSAAAGGRVDRIDVSSSAMDLDAATLSRIITETVREAQRDAADAAVRRMSESLGADSPLVESTRRRVDEEYAGPTNGRGNA